MIPDDYNTHWDEPEEIATEHLMERLHSSNKVQHVNERAHTSGQDILDHLHVSPMCSDHFVVQADLWRSRPRPPDKYFLIENMAQLIWMISLTSLHDLSSSQILLKHWMLR